MSNKNKPAKKQKSVVLANLLENMSSLDQIKIEQKMLLAARIGEMIKEKGWGKSEFALNAGKNPSEVSKWLSGVHNFTIDTLAEIATVLGITVQELWAPKQTQIIYKMYAQAVGIAESQPDYVVKSCAMHRRESGKNKNLMTIARVSNGL